MIIIDGHVHLHDQVPIEIFLDVTRDNLRRYCSHLKRGAMQAVLCLADFSHAEGFSRLIEMSSNKSFQNWQIKTTDDELSLLAQHSQGDKLWLIAGRQLVSAENVEVIGIGTSYQCDNSMSLLEIVEAINNLCAQPVIPWGAGKWWGNRGKIVSNVLNLSPGLLLGDSGGRPWCWRPNLLTKSKKNKIKILPGSDPLPVPSDQYRNGSYGIVINEPFDQNFPCSWLKNQLKQMPSSVKIFGGPLGLVYFLKCQIALWRKK